jgi:hypothetical protein
MQNTKRILIAAALGLLLVSPSASANDKLKLVGAWKLVSFFTEDVRTEVRNHIYGEHPQGYMAITPGGRFFSFATADWRKLARPPLEQIDFRSIFYSGRYRLEGNKFIILTDSVSNEGWEGSDPFDISWTEGWVGTEQVRFYRLDRNPSKSERLTMQTAAIPNPNGVDNMIIGTLIWERE